MTPTTPLSRLEAINQKTRQEMLARCNNSAAQLGDDYEESPQSPCEIGREYTVKQFAFSNEHGGTELVSGRAVVKAVVRFWDYETGWRFGGDVVRVEGKAVSVFSSEAVPTPAYVLFGQFDLV